MLSYEFEWSETNVTSRMEHPIKKLKPFDLPTVRSEKREVYRTKKKDGCQVRFD